MHKQVCLYTVPYIIWANYDIPEKDYGDFSLNYLSTVVTDVIGYPKTGYQSFLWEAMEYLPVVTRNFYRDSEGKWSGNPAELSEMAQTMLSKYAVLQYNGLRIIQHPQAFRFGMDAVLLADFMRVRNNERIADMGTGTGILPLLISQKNPTCTFDAFEIQPDMAEMAGRTVCLNGLQDRIKVHAADMVKGQAFITASYTLGCAAGNFIGGQLLSAFDIRQGRAHRPQCRCHLQSAG